MAVHIVQPLVDGSQLPAGVGFSGSGGSGCGRGAAHQGESGVHPRCGSTRGWPPAACQWAWRVAGWEWGLLAAAARASRHWRQFHLQGPP